MHCTSPPIWLTLVLVLALAACPATAPVASSADDAVLYDTGIGQDAAALPQDAAGGDAGGADSTEVGSDTQPADAADAAETTSADTTPADIAAPDAAGLDTSAAPLVANVTAVTASLATAGVEGVYTFSVTIASPDTGCEQYADWWEVVRPDGTLVYRRILGHSHVAPNPFTRSGGPVAVTADEPLIVRAHLNDFFDNSPGDYGGIAMTGSAATGFKAAELAAGFADVLQTTDPLVTACAF